MPQLLWLRHGSLGQRARRSGDYQAVKPKPAYLLILGLAIVVVVPDLARLDGVLLVLVVLGTLLLALVPT
jgi:hypothetical protein